MSKSPSTIPFRNAAFLSMGVFVMLWLLLSYSKSLSVIDMTKRDYLTIAHAQALPLDIEVGELENHESAWQPVEFPFHWREKNFNSRTTWYRLELSANELQSFSDVNANVQEQLWGIYLWRLNQTADIWFNGTKIGSGGSSGESMARYWNSPLYFSIPASLITQNNEILIKHFSQHSWGSMEAIVIGQEYLLKPIYNARYFIQHDVALGLLVFVLITGIFCFTVWVYRPKESQYLWFAISSVGLSFYCLNQFIRYLPINADAWRWLSNMSIDLWAVAIFIFMLRSLAIKKPRAEKLVLAYFLSGIPIYFYASFFQVFDINIYYHIGCLVIALSSFSISGAHYLRTRSSLSAFYAGVIAVVFVAGVHDTFMQAIVNNGWYEGGNPRFQNHFNSIHFAAPIIFLFLGASLIKHFINSMNAADKLNSELEQRVEDARQEIADSHNAMEQILINQSTSEERERIYRDLHDDVGSKLLSLYYRLDKKSDSILAKSALEDLRDIVSRKSLESCLLDQAAAQWRQEILERTSDAGIPLSWTFDSGGTELILSELQHTHLRRMLREVLSNAILHGISISEIKVRIEVHNNSLSISVSNDGAPKPVSSWQPGRGLSNLRVRSRDLRGDFEIKDLEGSWVQVLWSVPVDENGAS